MHKIKKDQQINAGLLVLVAGAGLEPAAFGL